jgi:hypothetical protein
MEHKDGEMKGKSSEKEKKLARTAVSLLLQDTNWRETDSGSRQGCII